MAIKGNQLIHVANQVLVDRAQTAGPGTVNLNRQKVYELGNYLAVGSLTDIPDLSFSMESFDASAQMECLLTNQDFAAMTDGTAINVAAFIPFDVASQFKAGQSAVAPYNTVGGIAIPYLTLESVSYKYGLTANASQTATLKGDGVFYTPGSVFIDTVAGTGTSGQTHQLAHDAYVYNGDVINLDRYAISISTSDGTRLAPAADYTEAATGAGDAKTVTITFLKSIPTTTKIRIVYSSDTVATYPQASHTPVSATRPAAIRGRNITVSVGGHAVGDRWTSIQEFDLDWKVSLERNEEFGNSSIVSQDFEVPDVTGKITVRPRDYADLYAKICKISGVTPGEVAGALTTAPLELYVELHSPDTGVVLKSFHIPDARFDLPGYSGRVQQKLDVDFNYTSDTGALTIYKGARP